MAQKAINNQWADAKNWPMHNFWAMVSSIKSTIKDDQVPALMTRYKIEKLSDYSLPNEVNLNA